MKGKANSARREAVRIVIADDSTRFREALAMLCSVLPRIRIVGQARNGFDALKTIRRCQPDFVILDLHMPGKGGLEVLKSIQRDGLSCTVIVLSGLIDEHHRRTCLALGAGFVFDKATELEAVRRLLGKL